ncbi:MAG: hypothetical protein RIT27_2253 [Pseudomonadota bacterium]|jgi:hypothetical protein
MSIVTQNNLDPLISIMNNTDTIFGSDQIKMKIKEKNCNVG